MASFYCCRDSIILLMNAQFLPRKCSSEPIKLQKNNSNRVIALAGNLSRIAGRGGYSLCRAGKVFGFDLSSILFFPRALEEALHHIHIRYVSFASIRIDEKLQGWCGKVWSDFIGFFCHVVFIALYDASNGWIEGTLFRSANGEVIYLKNYTNYAYGNSPDYRSWCCDGDVG